MNRPTPTPVRNFILALVVVLGFVGGRAFAQPERDAAAADARDAAADARGGATPADEGPVPPDPNHRWPGAMVLVILFMFIAAAGVGLAVRAHAPPEMPPTHSHHEPPGASHHHGHGGTINPVPHTVQELEGGHGDEPGHGHH